MEHCLRCNTLKCRKELNEQALVTTCSHCFCIDCANQFQLLNRQHEQYPTCPACHINLCNPDDAVVTILNPTEDYKTSVLSGLNPDTIMECAGRALSFWTYQATQEIVYQEYCAKNLTKKYGTLNAQMDKIIHDANSELSNMRDKMTNMQAEQDALRKKNKELIQQLRDKTRKYHQTQELYDKMKRRNLLDHVQDAASDAVEQTIQESACTNRYIDTDINTKKKMPPPPLFSERKTNNALNMAMNVDGSSSGGIMFERDGERTWPGGFRRQETLQLNQLKTPSTHRTTIPPGFTKPLPLVPSYTPMLKLYRKSPRELFDRPGSNSHNNGGYGMSAGVKVSNTNHGGNTGTSRPPTRTRMPQGRSSSLSNYRD
ncbi:BgTH12-04715 [Blumeria graminis f. sp. triticale]|uniref:BgTH12-04715 n=1 Tax=Blumeria graminis f. sp. triticale TaxID=1689686 RepID=A0A9W4CV08_BLUGR|nr:BgTH12-04715 [Blumeria graminis f. sp. triticale]